MFAHVNNKKHHCFPRLQADHNEPQNPDGAMPRFIPVVALCTVALLVGSSMAVEKTDAELFDALGLPHGASAAEAKKSYRQLSLRYIWVGGGE